MNIRALLASIALPLLLTSCGPDQPASPGPQANTPLQQNSVGYTSSQALDSVPANPAMSVPSAPALPQVPVPPDGANFTMLCQIFSDSGHILESEQLKNELIAKTGMKTWYVIHTDSESDLYYGYYKSHDDPQQAQETKIAEADHAKIAGLRDQHNDPIFRVVEFVPVNRPDPKAPAEWDVVNNPGYWTLLIAKYQDNPDRKDAAVQAVRNFRKDNIPAFYHHFDGVSEVYVGSWPRDSVKAGDPSAKADSSNPNEHLFVLGTSMALPDDLKITTKNDHKDVKVVMPRLQVQDPAMEQAFRQYPYMYFNGVVKGRNMLGQDGMTRLVPWPSYLVQIRPDAVAKLPRNIDNAPVNQTRTLDNSSGLGLQLDGR